MAHASAGVATDEPDTCFLFSPSSSYPQPFACLIDRTARLVHAWSNPLDQPEPAADPPTYLRGWNHVELGDDGSLYVTVPLQSLLKLGPDSALIWRAELSAHHDLDISGNGEVYVLTEEPRVVPWRDTEHMLLDNTVTVLDPGGRTLEVHSLYDVLMTHPPMRSLIDREIEHRRVSSHLGANVMSAGADFNAVLSGLAEPSCRRTKRDTLRFLRELPGSPGDVMHANTVEVLNAHPAGLWQESDVLVSLRNLDVIAALNLKTRSVLWFWGPGEVSGQHQPSALPNGHVLVFDNGQAAGRSRAIEIDPCTRSIVWQYTADPPDSLFSAMAGGCELLDNGNVLIADAQAGRAIEVTRGDQTVWGVQIHKTGSGTSTSRAAIYRMSAARAEKTASLTGGDETARKLVEARQLRCELIDAATVLSSQRK